MQYMIDDANMEHIQEAIAYGIDKVTANPTMYEKNQITLFQFIAQLKDEHLAFLSAEIFSDDYIKMKSEAETILAQYKEAVIKINFSKNGLKLCKYLHQKGIKTALTLVFDLPQVAAAIHAHADYIFFFIGRNDEFGNDGIQLLQDAVQLTKETSSQIVAASMKNMYHLKQVCKSNVPYAAIPYTLYINSLHHPLTEAGKEQFTNPQSL